MTKVHSIIITRNDDLIINHWFDKYQKIFDTISVCDGSDGDYTKNICKKYGALYTTDPTDIPFHEQYCRKSAFENLKPYLELGDWIVCSQVDEWYYHDPRKIINYVSQNDDVISWNQLNILPHPSEKEFYYEQIKCGTYNPTKIFKHYWFKQNTKTCFEPRMFKYTGNEVWSHQIPSTNSVCGRIQPISHNNFSTIIPTYFHYKVFDLNPEKYKKDSFSTFEKSKFQTGIGYKQYSKERKIETVDDLFFDENNIYCNMGRSDDNTEYVHGYYLKIPENGLLPEDHNYNLLGNDKKFLLIEN